MVYVKESTTTREKKTEIGITAERLSE